MRLLCLASLCDSTRILDTAAAIDRALTEQKGSFSPDALFVSRPSPLLDAHADLESASPSSYTQDPTLLTVFTLPYRRSCLRQAITPPSTRLSSRLPIRRRRFEGYTRSGLRRFDSSTAISRFLDQKISEQWLTFSEFKTGVEVGEEAGDTSS